MNDKNEQMELDLSALGNEPAPQAPPVQALPAKPARKKASKPAKEQAEQAAKQVVDLEDLDAIDTMTLIQQVLDNPDFTLSVTRKAWNGIRSRRKSQRVDGLRKRMKQNGFEVTASVTENPDGTGKWKSAVYAGEPGELIVLYGTEPGYGHAIKAK